MGVNMQSDMTRRPVSKEEFMKHVKDWPRPLVRDVYAVCDPAVISYNDFTYGDWPDSIVAFYYGEYAGDPACNWTIVKERAEWE